MALELTFKIEGGDFANAGKASGQVKKVMKQLNVDPRSIKRVVVAVYEAEVNVAAHAWRGRIKVLLDENEVDVTVSDDGPGIEDIEKAMEEGFSTASTEVREMGFGAGMGLPNIKRNSSEMKIESKPGIGTILHFKCFY